MPERNKITIPDLIAMKQRGEKIVRCACYDYPMAVLAERAGLHMINVGDSLGMNVLGYESTIPVTMDEMIHHCRAVARGVRTILTTHHSDLRCRLGPVVRRPVPGALRYDWPDPAPQSKVRKEASRPLGAGGAGAGGV